MTLPLTVFGGLRLLDILTTGYETQRLEQIQNSFNKELDTALNNTRAAVHEDVITRYIIDNDTTNTQKILYELADKYNLTTMVAVNKDGVATARVPSPRVGDYALQTTPWGREAAMHNEVVTVGVGRNFPLIINSAVPILQNNSFQGALFGGYILNDEQAIQFKQDHLTSQEQIAYYSKKIGLTGNSFNNQIKDEDLAIYFNVGSEWIQNGKSNLGGRTLVTPAGSFHVGNIGLNGLEGDVGGLLVFLPAYTALHYLIVGLILLAIFNLVLLRLLLSKRQSSKLNMITLFTITLLIITGTIFVHFKLSTARNYYLTKPQYTIYNSIIEFLPESDLIDLTKETRVGLLVTTGGEAINTAEAKITFDPSIIAVEDVLLTNSFCSHDFVIAKNIDNLRGEVTVACGKPGGFIGDRALLAELLVQPLRTGKLTLQFAPGTKVLAHDGLGTDVLRSTTDGVYDIIDPTTTKQHDPLLFSYSHPNEARWYNKKDVHISWFTQNNNQRYLYTINQSEDHSHSQPTTNGHADFSVNQDGIYDFHLFENNNESVHAHKTIHIDTTPPLPPAIRSSANEVAKGQIVRLDFSSTDALSGIQKNFYISFNDATWLPTLPQLYIPFLTAGQQKITVRVFDNAGNYSDSTTFVTVH